MADVTVGTSATCNTCPKCRQKAKVLGSSLRGLLSSLEIQTDLALQVALGGTKVLGKGWSDILLLPAPC